MNRKEAEDFVYKSYLKAEKYQDYHVRDAEKRRPDLTREIIRNRAKTPCVVVTGSKGKGSVANMISQILQTNYGVGLMTSPHLTDFCERFKINGVNISDDDFVKYMTAISEEIDTIDSQIPENICISPMGIQTDLALAYFNANGTTFNVFECGKGAKFDDVNNVEHEYAVINSIFLEHTRELGNTAEMIAADKAYVITGEQKCVYVARQTSEVLNVIEDRAKKLNVPIKVYGRNFWTENIKYSKNGMVFDLVMEDSKYSDVMVPLLGEHQAENCALAMAFCQDVMGINIDAVKQKLTQINWPGRMEVLSSEPFIMLDACINVACCNILQDVMAHLGIKNATVIIGIPIDKDYAGVVRKMNGVAGQIILTKSQNPHYIFTKEQSEQMRLEGIPTIWTDSIEEAIHIAMQSSHPIVILGTTSVVSEVKMWQKKRGKIYFQ